MQLHILNDQQVRLVADTSDGLDIQGAPFGPLQMLATSLALCTAAVIHDYAVTAQIKLDQFAVDVQWEYADHPYRVGQIEMTLLVPADVPPSRHRALLRAAEQCTVHNTLSHSPLINMGLEVHAAEQA